MRIAISTSSRLKTSASGSPRRTMLFLALLMAALIFLLALRLDFARYAFTAFLWKPADGVVLDPGRAWNPTIQFAAADGSRHTFVEDYGTLCGRRSLCYRRSFTRGEGVPVIYDPGSPNRAFVHDWALYSTIFEWVVEAFFLLLAALLMARLLSGGSGDLSIQADSPSGAEH
jgi:hypothetical protein